MPRSCALLVTVLAATAVPPSVRAQMDADGGPKSSLPPSAASTPRTSSPIRFVSPLRSFTVFDKESSAPQPLSPRRRFLPKFRAGLAAEKKARDAIAEELRASLLEEDEDYSEGGKEWAEMEAAREELRRAADEVRVERAYDRAVAKYDGKGGERKAAVALSSGGGANGKYQFVGVVSPPGSDKAVKWYARRKPSGAKWSVRMVHVDRDAVVKDMFSRGEVDVYGKYVNTGKKVVDRGIKEGEERETKVPVLEGKYTVKERSWRNLWNFSPLRLLSDSSGMYWRERRLSPGLYTDGRTVFESAYDYSDGRNGMRPVSSLDAYLKSGSVKDYTKTEVLRRLKEDGPDVVVEE